MDDADRCGAAPVVVVAAAAAEALGRSFRSNAFAGTSNCRGMCHFRQLLVQREGGTQQMQCYDCYVSMCVLKAFDVKTMRRRIVSCGVWCIDRRMARGQPTSM